MDTIPLTWIKLSRWEQWRQEFQAVNELKPILLHVLPSAGDDPPTYPPVDELLEAIELCHSPHIALHLSARRNCWPPDTRDSEVMERIIQTTLSWREQLPIPLLLENVTYYGNTGFMRCVSEPSFIREICIQTNTELLLDLAHARVAAAHRGSDIYEYLKSLPLALVREVHVNSPGIDPKLGLRDLHEEMQEEDYALLSWLLAYANPGIITLEYGGTGPIYENRSSLDALKRQFERLTRVIEHLG